MLVNIIIIKLIINLIFWYYYSCSAYDCVSKPNIYSTRSLMNLKMYIKSHKNLNIEYGSSLIKKRRFMIELRFKEFTSKKFKMYWMKLVTF